jgi:hypothetical protein
VLNRYRCVWLLPLLVVSLLTVTQPPSRSAAQSASDRLVLAFYYTWYSSDLWSSGKTSDAAAEPYNSTDPNAIARHVDQARGAGIDAFVASWYGPEGGVNNQTQYNFLQLLDIAAARGFRAAVDFETHGPFFADTGAVVNALRYAIDTLGVHPAYLRFNGKPVIFFWANNRFSPEEWASIRQQADPDYRSLWIAEGVTTRWLNVFDGLHLYNVAWSGDFASTATKFAGMTREIGKVWVATAMPGWNDTRVPGRAGAYAKDRAGGQFYRDSFSGAAASNPDMLIVTSFNEWMEGSQIEPSVGYGNTYLDLTRELSIAYKQGGLSGVAPAQANVAVEAPPANTPEPTLAPPTDVPPTSEPAPTEAPAPTQAPEQATPTDAVAAPPNSPTPPPFDTPVAYVAARVLELEPTATLQPSDTPTAQPPPTMLVATLSPEHLEQLSVGEIAGTGAGAGAMTRAGAILLIVAGVTIIGGGVVAVGLVWRKRQ